MPGIFSALGSFATKIWQSIRSVSQPIRTALGLAQQAGVDVETPALWREYRKAIRLEGKAEGIAGLDPSAYIPVDLWTESDIPWNRPYAYEVTMSGRDLATGRFARTSRVLTFSRQLTIDEVMEETENRFGREGAYPQIAVTHMSVTAAEHRPGQTLPHF